MSAQINIQEFENETRLLVFFPDTGQCSFASFYSGTLYSRTEEQRLRRFYQLYTDLLSLEESMELDIPLAIGAGLGVVGCITLLLGLYSVELSSLFLEFVFILLGIQLGTMYESRVERARRRDQKYWIRWVQRGLAPFVDRNDYEGAINFVHKELAWAPQ